MICSDSDDMFRHGKNSKIEGLRPLFSVLINAIKNLRDHCPVVQETTKVGGSFGSYKREGPIPLIFT